MDVASAMSLDLSGGPEGCLGREQGDTHHTSTMISKCSLVRLQLQEMNLKRNLPTCGVGLMYRMGNVSRLNRRIKGSRWIWTIYNHFNWTPRAMRRTHQNYLLQLNHTQTTRREMKLDAGTKKKKKNWNGERGLKWRSHGHELAFLPLNPPPSPSLLVCDISGDLMDM